MVFEVEKARRRIRICLLCVILSAVAVGAVYYLYSMRSEAGMTDGTLIAMIPNSWGRLIRNGIR